jgi:ribosomal protein L37AE/L43A
MVSGRGTPGEVDSIDPGHGRTKRGLQVLGIACLAVGGILALIGFVGFLNSFGDTDSGTPKGFVLVFIGVPLLGIGGTIVKFAFLGEMGRYGAGELAPVAKDTLEYIQERDTVACPSCGKTNEAGSNFCEACGARLTKSATAP